MGKVLHLISDLKFAGIHMARFDDPAFDNRYVYLATHPEDSEEYDPRLERILPFSSEYDALLRRADSFDLVMAYHLDYVKSCFINRLPGDSLVIWHLYGTELYNNYASLRDILYSNETKRILHANGVSTFVQRARRIAGRIRHVLLGKRPTYEEIRLAISRVGYLAWYSREEYDFLQDKLDFKLPPFLELSLFVREENGPGNREEAADGIWLGNSASPENNHVDILLLLQRVAFRGKIRVPFSYGQEKSYSVALHAIQSGSPLNIELLESFLDYKTYGQLLASCSAAIFNSYRQLALGNIFLAFRKGKKVYLNERNPSYQWLLSCGFHLFSVQADLEDDLKNGRLALTGEQQEENGLVYGEITSDAGNKIFLKKITELIRLNTADNK